MCIKIDSIKQVKSVVNINYHKNIPNNKIKKICCNCFI